MGALTVTPISHICVLASSPENDLFVLGVGWNGVSNPLLCHGIHASVRLLYLITPQSLFGTRFYERTCLQFPLDRWEGYLLSTTHSVLWYQNLESNQTLKVYETSMRIGASGIK